MGLAQTFGRKSLGLHLSLGLRLIDVTFAGTAPIDPGFVVSLVLGAQAGHLGVEGAVGGLVTYFMAQSTAVVLETLSSLVNHGLVFIQEPFLGTLDDLGFVGEPLAETAVASNRQRV